MPLFGGVVCFNIFYNKTNTVINQISGKYNNFESGTSTTTQNGITYVLDSTTTPKTAKVTKVDWNTTDSTIMGKENKRAYLNIPQKIEVSNQEYIVNAIGDGTNNVLTTSGNNNFAQYSAAEGDLYIVLPKSIRIVNTKAFSNCYTADDSTAVKVDTDRYVVLICLSNNVEFKSNSVASSSTDDHKTTQILGVRGSGAEKVGHFHNLFTYSKSGDTATITGCSYWGEDKIFDKLGSSARFNIEIPQYITESGTTYTVTAVGSNAFESQQRLQHVVIPATTKTIGSRAFADCENLTWAKILSNTVTISDTAFFGDDSMTLYGIPSSTTYAYVANSSTAPSSYKQLTLTKLTVKTKPTKTSYKVGETFNPSGLVLSGEFTDADGWVNTSDIIYETFNGGSYRGINLSGVDTTTAGTKTVTASYGNYNSGSATFSITVSESLTYQVVTLNKDGGTDGTDYIRGSSDGTIYVYDGTRDVMDILTQANDSTNVKKLSIPTKSGYEFLGYYYGDVQVIDSTGHLANTAYNGGFLVNYKVETLTAKWEEEKEEVTYQLVTLDKDGGTGGTDYIRGSSQGTIYVYDGTRDVMDILTQANDSTNVKKLSIPTKSGYEFLGYYYGDVQVIDSTGHLANTAYNGGFLVNYKIAKLTAKWEEETDVTIIRIETNPSALSGIELDGKRTATATAVVYYSDGTRKSSNGSAIDGIVWSSEDSNIVTIDQTGYMQGVSAGDTNIWVSTTDGKISTNIPVKVNAVALLAIKLNNETETTAEINVGEKINLEQGIKLFPTNATNTKVKWTSSNETVAKVSEDGEVTGIKPGKAMITVASVEDESVKAICEVIVKGVAVAGVTLDKTTAEVNVGGTIIITAIVEPNNASNKNIKWTSSDETVAKVSGDGVVTGIKAGTVTITATSEGNENIKASCIVEVKEKSSNVTDNTAPTIDKVVVGKDEDGNDVLYITATDAETGIGKVYVDGTDITNQKTEDGRYYYILEGYGDYVIKVIDNEGNYIEKTVTWKDNSENDGSGDNESGDNESGDNESGDNESGDNESGDNESGDNGSGDNGSGDNGSGSNGSGDNGSGDNGSGSNGSGSNGSGSNGSGSNGSGSNGSGSNGSGSSTSKDTTSGVSSTSKDSTSASSSLPKTGSILGIISMIGIIITSIFGSIYVIKYKNLNIK